jgi:hypothetical protein
MYCLHKNSALDTQKKYKPNPLMVKSCNPRQMMRVRMMMMMTMMMMEMMRMEMMMMEMMMMEMMMMEMMMMMALRPFRFHDPKLDLYRNSLPGLGLLKMKAKHQAI